MIDLKKWANTALFIMQNNETDTTDEIIKVNRESLVHVYQELVSDILPEIWKLPKEKQSILGGLFYLLQQYNNYFNEGWRSPYSIDVLPDLCKEKLQEVLNAKWE